MNKASFGALQSGVVWWSCEHVGPAAAALTFWPATPSEQAVQSSITFMI